MLFLLLLLPFPKPKMQRFWLLPVAQGPLFTAATGGAGHFELARSLLLCWHYGLLGCADNKLNGMVRLFLPAYRTWEGRNRQALPCHTLKTPATALPALGSGREDESNRLFHQHCCLERFPCHPAVGQLEFFLAASSFVVQWRASCQQKEHTSAVKHTYSEPPLFWQHPDQRAHSKDTQSNSKNKS